jgi:hypothetical protein
MNDTYVINSGAGPYAAGIPSEDVAISIATDALRYDDMALEGGDDDGNPVALGQARREVRAWTEISEFTGRPYVLVAEADDETARRGFGIHHEHRCPTCLKPGYYPPSA